jgi:hypothetical protein
MKKILVMSALLFIGNVFAVDIDINDCVLIKENKLSLYLDKDKVEDFLSQPYNEELIDNDMLYTIELQNNSSNKRKKIYKVCAIKKIKIKTPSNLTKPSVKPLKKKEVVK